MKFEGKRSERIKQRKVEDDALVLHNIQGAMLISPYCIALEFTDMECHKRL